MNRRLFKQCVPILVAIFAMLSLCPESEARCRLFGRRQRRCCPSPCEKRHCPAPGEKGYYSAAGQRRPWPVPAPAPAGIYICPMYRMGQVSPGVWMYYMVERNEDGVCGANPFGDYYGDITTGCHESNTNCYPVVFASAAPARQAAAERQAAEEVPAAEEREAAEERRIASLAAGDPVGTKCQIGYDGTVPQWVIDNSPVASRFEGRYRHGSRNVHLRCYTVTMPHASGITLKVNVGFQVEEEFDVGPGTYHRMGPKCGVVDKDGNQATRNDRYHVILIKN